MGNVSLCKESPIAEDPTKVKNLQIAGRGGVLQLASDCKVRVCVVAYDYHGYKADAQTVPRLSCVRDGVRFAKMAKDSGAEVSEFYDRPALNKAGEKKLSAGFPTKQVVLDEWRRIGKETSENDIFVFYFAGHGICRPREIEEGEEEMMIFMEPDGTPSHLTDNDVASVLQESFRKDAHILFITDCFHNSTLTDISRPALAGRPIVQLAAVKDQRHIAAVPKSIRQPFKETPSAFTKALLETVEALAEMPLEGDQGVSQDFSVVEVYNKILERYGRATVNQESTPTSPEAAPTSPTSNASPTSPGAAPTSPEAAPKSPASSPVSPKSSSDKQDFYFARTSKYDPDSFRWPIMPPPGWQLNDPLAPRTQPKGLGMFACIG